MWKCYQCGKQNQPNRNHCWHCGSNVDGTPPENPERFLMPFEKIQFKDVPSSESRINEKTDKASSSSTDEIKMRERMFRILNLIKSKELLVLEDFREEDASSFEIKTPYTEYDHRTWLKYELNNDGSAVRLELTHLFGYLDLGKGVYINQILQILSMNIPSFQNTSAYIGVRNMNGTYFVNLNATLIFLTKWTDEDIADALKIHLFDIITGLMVASPPPIKHFDSE